MNAAAASYLPGSWVAVSVPGIWLLVELRPEHEIVQRAWSLLSAAEPTDETVDELLDELVSDGIRAAPAFALLRLSGDDSRAIARRGASVVLDAAGATRTVAAVAGAAWADEPFDGSAKAITLRSTDVRAPSVELPMSSGVTMAASIQVYPDAEAAAAVHPIDPDAALSEPVAAATVTTEQSTATIDEADGGAAGLEIPANVSDAVQTASPGDAVAEDVPSYDFLFGATQRPPTLPNDAVDEPAPQSAEPDREPPANAPSEQPGWGETAGWHTSAAPFVPPAEPAPAVRPADPTPPPDAPTASSNSAGLIDALPWAVPGAPASADAPRWTPPQPVVPVTSRPLEQQPPPVVDDPPDEVVRTVDRSALLAALGDEPLIVGPTVLAGHCPAGHLSPPHAPVCRACGAAMPPQDAFEIARPPLGIIRLSTGDTVILDRGVLLGRAPSEPKDGEERPHLVKLASPENDISRNHAEIVLDGWHVFVRDLGSTNGTVVTLPGRAPTRLRTDDLQLLEHGSVVTIADEVSLTFEVTP